METKDAVENRPRTLEEWEAAIGVLAQGQINLEALVKALGELVRAQDLKLKMQQGLIDNMQQVLIDQGLAKPRPKEEAIVN